VPVADVVPVDAPATGSSWIFDRRAHSNRRVTATGKPASMLETLIIVLVLLWLLGLVTSYTLGGFIHVLIVIALVVFLLRVIRGRRLT